MPCSAIIVEDDCDPSLVINSTLIGTCFDSYVQIETQDWCNNIAETKTVSVWIDKVDPIPTCSFAAPETSKWSKIKSERHESDEILIVSDTGPGVQHDVMLQYDAKDNCAGPLDVKVSVFANEIEDFQSQQMALFYQTADDSEERAGLYVATTVCDVNTNGQCVKDPTRGDNQEDFRIYTVVVEATDESGRSDSTECKIVIVPQTWALDAVPSDQLEASSQRFFLASHTSQFRDTGIGS